MGVGGAAVLVGRTAVDVGVAVDGTLVAVGVTEGTSVGVELGTGVGVMGVDVGGTGVEVAGDGVGVDGGPPAALAQTWKSCAPQGPEYSEEPEPSGAKLTVTLCVPAGMETKYELAWFGAIVGRTGVTMAPLINTLQTPEKRRNDPIGAGLANDTRVLSAVTM